MERPGPRSGPEGSSQVRKRHGEVKSAWSLYFMSPHSLGLDSVSLCQSLERSIPVGIKSCKHPVFSHSPVHSTPYIRPPWRAKRVCPHACVARPHEPPGLFLDNFCLMTQKCQTQCSAISSQPADWIKTKPFTQRALASHHLPSSRCGAAQSHLSIAI